METLKELFEEQLKDLYNAEKQLTRALPAMAKKSSATTLKEAFTSHLEETRGHLERLETLGVDLEIRLEGKKCKAMEGLIEEGKEVLQEKGAGAVIDAALIAAAQRVEHYEISAYGSCRAFAEQLGFEEAAELLQETLDEESAADEKLTAISLEEILPATSGMDDEEAKPATAKASRRRLQVSAK